MHVGFGRELQQQRMKRGIELEAIAAGTRVSLRHLRALEDEKSTELPGGVFNKGILRSYCRFVGLEEGEWIERFTTSPLGSAAEPDWEEFAENVRRSRPVTGSFQRRRWGGVGLMGLGLVAILWLAWSFAIAPRVHGARIARAGVGHESAATSVAQPDAPSEKISRSSSR
jgi:cytoskeletal protein RodZ